jgi:ABC-type nickel/cobalt efflux system permease component RcnA
MTLGGWIFMLASWGLILGLCVFSLVRTLRAKDNQKHDSGEE